MDYINTNKTHIDDEAEIKTRRMIPESKRLAVYYFLISVLKNDSLPFGAYSDAARIFDIHEKSVRRIWKKASQSVSNTETGRVLLPDVSHSMLKTGRKIHYSRAEILEKLRAIPCKHRSTLREAAHGVGMSCTHFHRILKKEKIIVPCSTVTKPLLTNIHRTNRLQFVRERISVSDPSVFHSQFNVIHLDEKWFNERSLKSRYYRCKCNDEPKTSYVRHKSHIPKVMFISAVCRPRRFRRSVLDKDVDDNGDVRLIADEFGANKEWYFDGKIGLYPLTEYRETKRKSKYHEKGDLLMHPINLNAETYNKYIVNELLPDIRSKCPPEMLRETVYVQHDNAPAHALDHVKIAEKCVELGIDVKFYYQPAQSPDLNINDLVFFVLCNPFTTSQEQKQCLVSRAWLKGSIKLLSFTIQTN